MLGFKNDDSWEIRLRLRLRSFLLTSVVQNWFVENNILYNMMCTEPHGAYYRRNLCKWWTIHKYYLKIVFLLNKNIFFTNFARDRVMLLNNWDNLAYSVKLSHPFIVSLAFLYNSSRCALNRSQWNKKCNWSSTLLVLQRVHMRSLCFSFTNLPVSTLSGSIPYLNWDKYLRLSWV